MTSSLQNLGSTIVSSHYSRVYTEQEHIAKTLGQLYQVDVVQPLTQVKQQVLEVIAPVMGIDFIVWNSELDLDLLDQKSLLTKYGITRTDVALFDIKLHDSNVRHQFLVCFSIELSDVQVTSASKHLSTFLPLLAEIYRQTVIHSYYKKWKTWPFLQFQEELNTLETNKKITDKFLDKTNLSDVYFEERWELNDNIKQRVLVRVERVENKLFVDKFILPEPIQSLTNKQKQICFYLKACYSNQEIADMLKISIKTVGNHLTAIYEKLNISRSQLFQLLNAAGDT